MTDTPSRGGFSPAFGGCMENRIKVWHVGKAPQDELEEIDRCKLCEIMPELEQTCYATEYCHRQIKMEFVDRKHGNTD